MFFNENNFLKLKKVFEVLKRHKSFSKRSKYQIFCTHIEYLQDVLFYEVVLVYLKILRLWLGELC